MLPARKKKPSLHHSTAFAIISHSERKPLPSRSSPVRPGLLAEHLVALQARLVRLAEGVTSPADAHVLHQAQVAHLVAHQGLGEDVRRLFVVGFDAAAVKNKHNRGNSCNH